MTRFRRLYLICNVLYIETDVRRGASLKMNLLKNSDENSKLVGKFPNFCMGGAIFRIGADKNC